jgi:hypothetical protein
VITVSYANTRGEVWRWYARLWLRRLWPIDLGLAFTLVTMAGFLSSNIRGLAFPPLFFGILGGVALLALAPVLRLTVAAPAPRTLTVGPEGVSEAGRRRTWREITQVDDVDGAAVLNGANRNAFIVPARAFASEEARQAFLAAARAWKAASA